MSLNILHIYDFLAITLIKKCQNLLPTIMCPQTTLNTQSFELPQLSKALQVIKNTPCLRARSKELNTSHASERTPNY